MDNNRPPRKRIYKEKIVVVDELAFIPNKASVNARQINSIKKSFEIHIWVDKHYHKRHHLGEDDGGKREGIDFAAVEELVNSSIEHLLFYSSLVKVFSFLNKEQITGQPNRMLLRKDMNDTKLNVLIQAHYHEPKVLEVTVVTAMCVNDFRIGDGQYILDIYDDGSSLIKYENKVFKEIASF